MNQGRPQLLTETQTGTVQSRLRTVPKDTDSNCKDGTKRQNTASTKERKRWVDVNEKQHGNTRTQNHTTGRFDYPNPEDRK